MSRNLFIFLDEKRLIQGVNTAQDLQNPVFYSNDSEDLRLVFLTANPSPDSIYQRATVGGVKAALGVIDRPKGGTFKIEYDTEQTGELDYNITALDFETALNSLVNVDVSVSGPVGGPFQIKWDDVGAKEDFSFDAGKLSPASAAVIQTVKLGDATTQEVVSVRLIQKPVAFQSDWTAVEDIVIDDHTVTIDELVYGGTFTLTHDGQTTGELAYNVSASEVKTALEALSTVTSVSVSKVNRTYTITGLTETLTFNSSLLGYGGVTGNINFATFPAIELLGNSSSISTFFEVETSGAGTRRTQIQVPSILKADIIDGNALETVPFDNPAYASDVVSILSALDTKKGKQDLITVASNAAKLALTDLEAGQKALVAGDYQEYLGDSGDPFAGVLIDGTALAPSDAVNSKPSYVAGAINISWDGAQWEYLNGTVLSTSSNDTTYPWEATWTGLTPERSAVASESNWADIFDDGAVKSIVNDLLASSSTLSISGGEVTVDLETPEYQHTLTVNGNVEFLITGTSQIEKAIYINFTASSVLTFPAGVNWLSMIPAEPVTYEDGDKALLLVRWAPDSTYWIGVIKANETE